MNLKTQRLQAHLFKSLYRLLILLLSVLKVLLLSCFEVYLIFKLAVNLARTDYQLKRSRIFKAITSLAKF